MKKINPNCDYIVASRENYGKCLKRKCIYCKNPVYPMDKTVVYAKKTLKNPRRKSLYALSASRNAMTKRNTN